MVYWGIPSGPGAVYLAIARRRELETEVQMLVGQIVNIADLRDADLYGIRDGFVRKITGKRK